MPQILHMLNGTLMIIASKVAAQASMRVSISHQSLIVVGGVHLHNLGKVERHACTLRLYAVSSKGWLLHKLVLCCE